MRSTEETVAAAMDVSDKELLPFLPYILQDFWEIGTEPETVIYLIEKHFNPALNSTVLDLGCGKGAVSIKIASKLKYKCYGIDAIPEFIEFAISKANEHNVNDLCRFEIGDIREKINSLNKFDIIVLGAVGPVFGNYYETLSIIEKHLTTNGLLIIDDGFVDDACSFAHPEILTKRELLNQIEKAGMFLLDEVVAREDVKVLEGYDKEYVNLEKRCNELIAQHPEKAGLFSDYIKKQKEEYSYLKSEIIGSTMVLRQISPNK